MNKKNRNKYFGLHYNYELCMLQIRKALFIIVIISNDPRYVIKFNHFGEAHKPHHDETRLYCADQSIFRTRLQEPGGTIRRETN